MNPKNAIIYPEQKTFGDTQLSYVDFIRHSFIQILTLESLVEWNNTLILRRN